MEYLNIGPLHIPLNWVFIGLAIIISIFIMKVYLQKKGMEHKEFVDDVWNGIFIFIMVWKISLIIFEPDLIVESPLSLLYFSGGGKGIWLGLAISLLYVLRKSRKNDLPYIVLINRLVILGLIMFGMYHFMSIALSTDIFFHIFSGLSAILLSIILMIYTSVKQLKTMMVMSLLLGLIGWTLYDHFSNNAENPLTTNEAPMTSNAEIGLQVGNQAPDFELTTLNGIKLKLSEYKGKIVILNFWATWCPPCKAEMPHMQNFYDEQQNSGIEILAVNLRNSEKNDEVVKQFVDDYHLTFPILLDTNDISKLYQAFTIPTSYVIDADGIIQYRIVGPMSKEKMENMMDSLN